MARTRSSMTSPRECRRKLYTVTRSQLAGSPGGPAGIYSRNDREIGARLANTVLRINHKVIFACGAVLLCCWPVSADDSAVGRAPAWPDTFVARVEAVALLQTLNVNLLSHDSATLTRERWCDVHRLASPARIVPAFPTPHAVVDAVVGPASRGVGDESSSPERGIRGPRDTARVAATSGIADLAGRHPLQ